MSRTRLLLCARRLKKQAQLLRLVSWRLAVQQQFAVTAERAIGDGRNQPVKIHLGRAVRREPWPAECRTEFVAFSWRRDATGEALFAVFSGKLGDEIIKVGVAIRTLRCRRRSFMHHDARGLMGCV